MAQIKIYKAGGVLVGILPSQDPEVDDFQVIHYPKISVHGDDILIQGHINDENGQISIKEPWSDILNEAGTAAGVTRYATFVYLADLLI